MQHNYHFSRMAVPTRKTLYMLDEYFTLTEHEDDVRYEYHYGKIVAMAGGLLRHNYVAGNMFGELRNKLKGRRCVPFNSDTRLQVDAGLWVYLNVMVSCHEEDIHARLYVKHPTLIVEVLSGTDYTFKKHHYFKIPDLQYYILIETESIFIYVYEKQGSFWVNKTYTAEDTHISLPLSNIELVIADLYEWVTFEAEEG